MKVAMAVSTAGTRSRPNPRIRSLTSVVAVSTARGGRPEDGLADDVPRRPQAVARNR